MLLLLALACKGDAPPDTDPAETGETGEVSARAGFCAPEQRIGSVRVERYGDGAVSSFTVQIQDTPHPLAAPAVLETEACSYHEYTPGFCDGGCGAQQLCSPEGVCEDTPRNLKGLELTLWADGVESTHQANDQGLIFGQLGAETRFVFKVSGEGVDLESSELALPTALAAEVVSAGDYDAPGALSVSWEGTSEATVHTDIPINHHAASQTFTGCQAPASAGGFQVPAEMVNPLAVHTGLEFQGLEFGSYEAIETPQGCVQVSVLTHAYVDVTFSP